MIDLLLFSTDTQLINRAVAGGLDGVMIDWESIGKLERQRDHDTQINHDTLEDLVRVCRETSAPVSCRINAFGPTTNDEIEVAIATGAREIFLPMVRTPNEVEAALKLIDGRTKLAILIETREALLVAADLAKLPLSRVYVGLMDLHIALGTPHIFVPVIDGTIDRIRPHFTMPFGFGGLTVPEGGDPIPSRLLLAEMARLRCGFTFLRRSFLRDVSGRDVPSEVRRIRAAIAAAFERAPDSFARDREELREVVAQRLP